MPIDTTNLPISGGVLLAGAAYVAVSVFVTGPLVGHRSIEHSNWDAVCRSNLHAEIKERKSPPQLIPKTDCKSILGGFLPELGAICQQYGNPDFGGPATGILRQQERMRRDAEKRRLSRAASQSGSRCDCATSIVSENRSWALVAGSLRLISPPSTGENLQSELTQALNSSLCSGKE